MTGSPMAKAGMSTRSSSLPQEMLEQPTHLCQKVLSAHLIAPCTGHLIPGVCIQGLVLAGEVGRRKG